MITLVAREGSGLTFMRICFPPPWCPAISVVEFMVAAFKNMWLPKANPAVSVDGENREAEDGDLDVASKA